MPDHSSQGVSLSHVACCVLHATSGGRTTPFLKGKIVDMVLRIYRTLPKTRKYALKKKKMKRLDPDFFAFDSCLGDLSTDKNVEFVFLIIS